MKKIFSLITALIACIFFLAQLHAQQVPGKKASTGKPNKMNLKEKAARSKKQTAKQPYRIAPEENANDEEDWTKPKKVDNLPANKMKQPARDVTPKTHVAKPNTALEVFPCNDFIGSVVNNAAPPDANGAAGFNQLMTTINLSVRIMNKRGGLISEVDLTDFWSSTGQTDIFDPKISYDPYNQRWIFICCAARKSAASALLLAVSQTYDPSGNWNIYNIDADADNHLWFDYPSVGFNRNWIVVGGNMFQNPNDNTSPSRARIWVFNKQEVYAGGSTSYSFFDRTDLFTICPALTYNDADNTEWLLTNWNSNSGGNGFVKLLSLTGTAAAPVLNINSTVNVGPSWASGGVVGTQPNTLDSIDLGDHRMKDVCMRNGQLWFTQTTFLPTVNPVTSCVQIGNINPSAGSMNETIIRIVDLSGNTKCVYPSITVNKDNDFCVGYSTIYTNGFPSAQVSIRRAGDPAINNYLYKGGENTYGNSGRLNRWGDYSATHTDPEDDKTMWTTSEYPRANNTHGTWWAKICPNSCTNDYALSGNASNSFIKYEANNTIISTTQIQTNSFIKYDAGLKITLLPGFQALSGTNFQAYIEGCGGNR